MYSIAVIDSIPSSIQAGTRIKTISGKLDFEVVYEHQSQTVMCLEPNVNVPPEYGSIIEYRTDFFGGYELPQTLCIIQLDRFPCPPYNPYAVKHDKFKIVV